MKSKILFTSACLLGLATSSHAAVIFSESFDYTGGSELTANGWSAFSAGGAVGAATIGSGLTFGSGNILSVSGGAVDMSVTDGDASGTFSNAGYQSSNFGGSFTTINSGTLWRSYLFTTSNSKSVGNDGNNSYGIDTNIVRYDVAVDAGGNANRIPGSTDSDAEERKFTLNAKNFTGSGALGHWSHDNGVSSSTNALSINTTYLLISSYDFTSKDNTIWVFDETEGQAVLDARASGSITATTLDNAVASGFKVTQTDGSSTISVATTDSLLINMAFNNAEGDLLSGTFDELRVTTDLNDAITVVPEPSTYALFCGFLALGGVMIRRRLRG